MGDTQRGSKPGPQQAPQEGDVAVIEETEDGDTTFALNVDPNFIVQDLEQENAELRRELRRMKGGLLQALNELKQSRAFVESLKPANRQQRRAATNGKAKAASKASRATSSQRG